jgi:hypothetical protein
MKENFDKNEVLPTSEVVTPTEDTVESKKEIDLDEIEGQIAAVELANVSGFEAQRKKIKNEDDDRQSRRMIVGEIKDMVKGNMKLSDFTNESLEFKKRRQYWHESTERKDRKKPGTAERDLAASYSLRDYQRMEQAREDKTLDTRWDVEKQCQLKDARHDVENTEDFQALKREWANACQLRHRIYTLLNLPNLQSPTDLEVKDKELASRIEDLEHKMGVLLEEGEGDLKKVLTEHETQQDKIAENPVVFAIEEVRASNPEEFDRLFPDIEALKKEIGK